MRCKSNLGRSVISSYGYTACFEKEHLYVSALAAEIVQLIKSNPSMADFMAFSFTRMLIV